MNKRLSFVPTLMIGFVVVFVLGAGAIWLEESFSLPDWIFSVFLLTILGAYFEVVSRLGPKEFDAPISRFLKLSARDKVVLLTAIVAIIIIMLLAKSFDSGWVKLLFLALALLVFQLIYSRFGSKELKELIERTPKDRDKPQ